MATTAYNPSPREVGIFPPFESGWPRGLFSQENVAEMRCRTYRLGHLRPPQLVLSQFRNAVARGRHTGGLQEGEWLHGKGGSADSHGPHKNMTETPHFSQNIDQFTAAT